MLAESGLKRRSRYATATLLVGANLPDIDVLAGIHGSDFELYARRGHTHGILAMLVLPLLLAAGVWLWHRWRGARAPADAPPFNPRAILALAFLAVWSHPLLDWLNTYGVRLLMPFDGRWFYGDTLFIIDPWFWLLAAAGVVMARATLLCLVLYVGVMHLIARTAEATVAKQYAAATQVQANPLPGTPLSRRMVVVEPDTYRILTPQGEVQELPRSQPDAIVRAALQDSSIRGFVTWMRLPYWTVEDEGDHWRVRFLDLRYQGPDLPNARDIGFAQVAVPKFRIDSPGENTTPASGLD